MAAAGISLHQPGIHTFRDEIQGTLCNVIAAWLTRLHSSHRANCAVLADAKAMRSTDLTPRTQMSRTAYAAVNTDDAADSWLCQPRVCPTVTFNRPTPSCPNWWRDQRRIADHRLRLQFNNRFACLPSSSALSSGHQASETEPRRRHTKLMPINPALVVTMIPQVKCLSRHRGHGCS